MGRVMPRFSIALSILVLHFTFHSTQAQPDETKTGKATISGMAAKNEIELQPCGRVKDYVLRFNR
jgi:hypothetical protein